MKHAPMLGGMRSLRARPARSIITAAAQRLIDPSIEKSFRTTQQIGLVGLHEPVTVHGGYHYGLRSNRTELRFIPTCFIRTQ